MSLTEPTRPSTDSTGHPRKPVTANNMVRSLLANRVPCWLWSAGGGAVERHVDPSCLTLMVLSPDQMLNPIDSSFGTLASAPTWVSMPCSHLFSLTVATRSKSSACLMSNLTSSQSAPAPQPWTRHVEQ